MTRYMRHTVKALVCFQLLVIYAWLVNLTQTDSYYSVYLLCAIAGVLCLCDNYRKQPEVPRRTLGALSVCAGLFSLATLLANYTLFEPFSALLSLFNAVCSFLGGWCLGLNILLCLLNRLPLAGDAQRQHPARLFLAAFGSIAAIDLAYLFFVSYPGILTTDAISTMEQVVNGSYNNTMPFWHTMTVKLFYEIGMVLFGEVNAAVAFFHCAQILFLAACFAYALVTLYQAGVPRWGVGAAYALYAFLPYNIAYSSTMWKDILFAGAALLLVTAFYRLLSGLGKNRRLDQMLFALGAAGLCLWRTNGWYALLVTALVLAVFLRKRQKMLLILLAAVLILCWILLNPVLSVLNVSSTDLIEALAVPFQQLARVIAEGRELTQEESQQLSQIFDLELVAELYTPGTVDPIKFEAFRHDNRAYAQAHFLEYLGLYLRLGLRYPGDYLKAWIEETKGYWNGGYSYWIYNTQGVDTNNLGIVSSAGSSAVSAGFAALFRYLEKMTLLQPLYSIGLHVWALFACFFLNLWKKREEFALAVPILVLIVGLWLGTPVYAEFRYAYPLFLTMPVILAATFYGRRTPEQP